MTWFVLIATEYEQFNAWMYPMIDSKNTAERKEGVFEHAQFTGLRNTVPPSRFDLGDLAEALNVDIDDSLLVQRRKGFDQIATGNFHSFWSDGVVAFAVLNQTDLVRIFADYTVEILRTGLTSGLYMSFASIGPQIVNPESTWRVYFTNGSEKGVIDSGRVRSWGLDIPTHQPDAALVGGYLTDGIYQFAATFLRKDKQESGTLVAGSIVLSDEHQTHHHHEKELVAKRTSGIQLTNIPVSDDPDVDRVLIYFSRRNGESLYRAGSVSNGETSYTYDREINTLTLPMRHQHMRPPMPGQIVMDFNGHLLIAQGSRLFRSESYGLELFDHRKGYEFTDEITLVGALNNGVYLGVRSKIFYLNGPAPAKWSYKPIAEYGAIPGAFDYVSLDMLGMKGDGIAVLFATTRGLCVGIDGGQFINLTQEKFVYPIQERGAVVVRRHRGMIQALLTMQGNERSPSAAQQRNQAWMMPTLPVVTGEFTA